MIAERLKLIRQARNLSLDELSAAMDGLVTKQALSKYETGKDRPSPSVLRRLAVALRVPVQSLLEPPAFQVQPIAYRKAAKMGKKQQAHYESLLLMHLEQAMRLRDLVEPSNCFDVPVLHLAASSAPEAEEAASSLRARWNLGRDPIPNLVDVLEAQGVFVVGATGVDSFGGLSAIAKDAAGQPCGAAVMYHTDFCLERQRLTLAHELAHVVLMVPEGEDAEMLAFRFAGAFLCPATTLLSDVGRSRSKVLMEELRLLRRRYGMSMQAILRRMKDLDIISPTLYKDACIYFSRSGQRQREHGQTDQGEQPQWMERTVYRALGERLITQSDASEFLGAATHDVKPRTLMETLREMNPSERERLIEAHVALHAGSNEGLDEEWMDATLEGEE